MTAKNKYQLWENANWWLLKTNFNADNTQMNDC